MALGDFGDVKEDLSLVADSQPDGGFANAYPSIIHARDGGASDDIYVVAWSSDVVSASAAHDITMISFRIGSDDGDIDTVLDTEVVYQSSTQAKVSLIKQSDGVIVLAVNQDDGLGNQQYQLMSYTVSSSGVFAAVNTLDLTLNGFRLGRMDIALLNSTHIVACYNDNDDCRVSTADINATNGTLGTEQSTRTFGTTVNANETVNPLVRVRSADDMWLVAQYSTTQILLDSFTIDSDGTINAALDTAAFTLNNTPPPLSSQPRHWNSSR